MGKFRVVDLYSQAEAVASHVSGWSKVDFLRWLSQFGNVEVNRFGGPGSPGWLALEEDGDIYAPDHPDLYSFDSPAGRHTPFLITTAGELVICGFFTAKAQLDG